MLTPHRAAPRHGAVVIGDFNYVAGGGPQMGGGVKSAINKAFAVGVKLARPRRRRSVARIPSRL